MVTIQHLVASHSYYHDSLTWCVQKAKDISSWINLFYVCTDPIVYIVATVEIFLIVGTAYILQQLEDARWDWNRISLYTIGVALGFAVDFMPKSIPFRIFFIIQLFAAMFFGIKMSSTMITQATTPIRNPQINSVQEMIDRDFSFTLDRFTFTKLSQLNEVHPVYSSL